MKRTNDGGHVIGMVLGETREEMAALDRLGPLMRRAINEAPIRYSALGVIRQVEDEQERRRQRLPEGLRHHLVLDPSDYLLDAHMARGLLIESRKTIARDRDEADAALGVEPIVPRRGSTRDIRVVRSERTAERRARRFYR